MVKGVSLVKYLLLMVALSTPPVFAQVSPNDSIPPATELIDAKGQKWIRGPEAVAGQKYTHIVNNYVLCNGIVYGFNILDQQWWQMDMPNHIMFGPNSPCVQKP